MATAVSDKQRSNIVNNSECTPGSESKSSIQNGSTDVDSDVNVSSGVNKHSVPFSMNQYVQAEGPKTPGEGAGSKPGGPMDSVPVEGMPQGPYGGRTMHGEQLMHDSPSQYGPQGIRHPFGGKLSMNPPRSPGSMFSQQRFMSGQSISQPTGPTPTLNQLLQTSNAIQRMQNSYGPGEPTGVYGPQQGWLTHPMYVQGAPNPGPQAYRNPSPPFRPAQSSTPTANAPEAGELAGQNSNDSCSGGAGGGAGPGTPNSQQGMRPTPSPTGSTGSRSMSPAVGQQNIQMPPRPSSGQSDGGGTGGRMSHSPMGVGPGYQGPPAPPHLSGYKLSSGPAPGPSQPLPPYSSQQQPPPHGQFSPSPQGNYAVRPQGNMQYGSNQVYGGLPNTGPPNTGPGMGPSQYPGRSMPNHFSSYSQTWGGAATPASKPSPTVSQPSSPANAQSPRPPHYLKTHLQHKMGYGGGIVPSHSPPQNYPGPGPGPVGMGPPGGMHHPGPMPMGPPPIGSGHMNMGPPHMAPPVSTNSHDGAPMPPPCSTPNPQHGPDSDSAHDNGITTTAGGAGTHITPSVTSVVTTGPDGTPLDEGSQQSTLSNASVASGEDPQCSSSKSRKNELGSGGSGAGHYSHPATPQSTAPSPGAASMNSVHADEYDISSPGWPRTPASPVFNSHAPPPETYRSKKTDSLSKLYEMDDSPERRAWLDKLLAFMEERRTPITTCPTISKNPLDLFRLYIYVKDRGGFMEVTKNKTWKDIAGMLGIGASSSAAYTLRKHYTKNLLAYECKFDRGGIDPQPIINQVESTSKKKGAKAASVPSPGSSNSQDSFPTPGSGGASMDGYNAYYPPGSTPDYNSPPMPRPSSQANAPSPHPGNHQQGDNISVSNPFDDVASGQQRYPGGPVGAQGPGGPYTGPGMPPRSQGYAAGYNQYPPPGNSPDPYQSYSNNSAYPSTTRPMGYPSYSPDGDRPAAFNQSSSNSMTTSMASNMSGSSPSASTASPGHDPYGRYGMSTGGQSGGYPPPPPRPGYSAPAPGSGPGGPGPGPGPSPAANQPGPQQPPAPYPAQSEYYRNDSNYPSGGGQTSPVSGGASNQVYGNGPHSKTMPPPAPQPRRHPDFAKDQQQYPPYSQQKSQMYGWPNNQYRGQYSGQNTVPPAGQQWNQSGVARGAVPTTGGTPPASGPGGPAWGGPEHRYPLTAQTGAGPGAAPGPGYQPGPGHQPVPGQQWPPVSQSPNIRPAVRPTFRPEGKPFNMPPPQGLKTAPGLTNSSYTQQPLPKREITFPPDSVEATVPVLYRRKRLCRADVAPLDAWRIMMCLRSGLLAESTWALDVLNVLLYDDSSIAYFGLSHLPGMLDILLEHFERSLSDMFDGPTAEIESRPETNGDVDLGAVTKTPDPNDRTVLLHNTPSYSMTSRKGRPVRVIPKDEDIFILDNQKDWDVDGEQSVTAEVTPGPWHLVSSSEIAASTKHIVTCFQAEFGNIPFARLLPTKLRDEVVVKIEEQTHVDGDSEDDKKRTKTLSEVVVDTIKEENRKTEETEETKLDVRDPAGTLKRRRISDYEDEAYSRDEASLHLVTETQDCVGKRCACISNILRNLTFVPGNELEFAKSQCFLGLVGKLLLLHHEHPARAQKTRNYDREEDADFGDTCSSLQAETEWWWDYLTQVRENVLVAVANIAGHVDLAPFEEEVSRPVLDGLLHWAVCPSAHGQDPFQSLGPTSSLSPQRLALEALCKLCVTDSNVDLVIATPPYSRLERLCGILTKLLCRSEEQVLREFAVNLLHYLAAADSGVARSIALQSPCVSLLVAFIEQAEQSALSIANQHGIGALRENPDAMGTSLDMLRRAAHTLLHLSRHPDNRPLFLQQEQRLLALVMSQILDQQVASVISRVLFQVSRVPPEHPDTS